MKTSPFAAVAVSAALLAGCASQSDPYGSNSSLGGNKQIAGTVLGGVVGGLAGSRFGGGSGKLITTGVGTLLGAALGNAAGQSLDRADQNYAQRAASNAYVAPTGSTIRWNNPENGNWGTYTPVRDGTGPSGEFCREFQTTIVVGGRTQQGVGTACQQRDGTWRVVG